MSAEERCHVWPQPALTKTCARPRLSAERPPALPSTSPPPLAQFCAWVDAPQQVCKFYNCPQQ
eukprot:38910-Pleurochrysis_carterae.AAC.1